MNNSAEGYRRARDGFMRDARAIRTWWLYSSDARRWRRYYVLRARVTNRTLVRYLRAQVAP